MWKITRSSWWRTCDERFILVFYFILFCFFFNDTATTEIYTLSLHDALPISLPPSPPSVPSPPPPPSAPSPPPSISFSVPSHSNMRLLVLRLFLLSAPPLSSALISATLSFTPPPSSAPPPPQTFSASRCYLCSFSCLNHNS